MGFQVATILPVALGLCLMAQASPARAEKTGAAGEHAPTKAPAETSTWCVQGFETLPGEVCYAAPEKATTEEPRTLVVFLHGLIDGGTDWQHQQQKGMLRAANKHRFSLLAPKGRSELGGKRKPDQIGWPTSAEAQGRTEEEVLATIASAKKQIEERQQAPFDETFVLGFSNGAYYGASLALRGKLLVQGYGVFAGGGAPDGMDRVAKSTKNRVPVFVGIAEKDSTAEDGKELRALLKKLAWPHKAVGKKVGHVVADSHLEEALTFLQGEAKKSRKILAADAAKASKAKPASPDPDLEKSPDQKPTDKKRTDKKRTDKKAPKKNASPRLPGSPPSMTYDPNDLRPQ